MRPASDLVRDSKLRTAVHGDITRHLIETSGCSGRQRKVRHEQQWRRAETLGEGAFGVVWKEVLIAGQCDVKERAVKMVKRSYNSKPVDYHKELEAIAKFSHLRYKFSFVESFGWWETEDAVFITMEFLPRGDLDDYLNNVSTMPEPDVREISFQVLEGLKAMHDNSFAHRDLKPSNILIKDTGPDWWVKIADFGISKRAEEGVTALKTFNGTPGFIAPEILIKNGFLHTDLSLSTQEYSLAVDLWSMGETIYRCLCGESPFTTSLSAYVGGKRLFPTENLLERGISKKGQDLIQQLMAVEPNERLEARHALTHPWFSTQQLSLMPSLEFSNSKPEEAEPPYLVEEDQDTWTEPSARWSTLDVLIPSNTWGHAVLQALGLTATSAPISGPPSIRSTQPLMLSHPSSTSSTGGASASTILARPSTFQLESVAGSHGCAGRDGGEMRHECLKLAETSNAIKNSEAVNNGPQSYELQVPFDAQNSLLKQPGGQHEQSQECPENKNHATPLQHVQDERTSVSISKAIPEREDFVLPQSRHITVSTGDQCKGQADPVHEHGDALEESAEPDILDIDFGQFECVGFGVEPDENGKTLQREKAKRTSEIDLGRVDVNSEGRFNDMEKSDEKTKARNHEDTHDQTEQEDNDSDTYFSARSSSLGHDPGVVEIRARDSVRATARRRSSSSSCESGHARQPVNATIAVPGSSQALPVEVKPYSEGIDMPHSTARGNKSAKPLSHHMTQAHDTATVSTAVLTTSGDKSGATTAHKACPRAQHRPRLIHPECTILSQKATILGKPELTSPVTILPLRPALKKDTKSNNVNIDKSRRSKVKEVANTKSMPPIKYPSATIRSRGTSNTRGMGTRSRKSRVKSLRREAELSSPPQVPESPKALPLPYKAPPVSYNNRNRSHGNISSVSSVSDRQRSGSSASESDTVSSYLHPRRRQSQTIGGNTSSLSDRLRLKSQVREAKKVLPQTEYRGRAAESVYSFSRIRRSESVTVGRNSSPILGHTGSEPQTNLGRNRPRSMSTSRIGQSLRSLSVSRFRKDENRDQQRQAEGLGRFRSTSYSSLSTAAASSIYVYEEPRKVKDKPKRRFSIRHTTMNLLNRLTPAHFLA